MTIPLAKRIEDFFRANPHEELTYVDITQKFGVSAQSARSCVKDLRKKRAPLIESVHIIRCKAKGTAC